MADYLGSEEIKGKKHSFVGMKGAGMFTVREEDGLLGMTKLLVLAVMGIEQAQLNAMIEDVEALRDTEAVEMLEGESLLMIAAPTAYIHSDVIDLWVMRRAAQLRGDHGVQLGLVAGMLARYEEVQGEAVNYGALIRRMRIKGTADYIGFGYSHGGVYGITERDNMVGISYEVIDSLSGGVLSYGKIRRLLSIAASHRDQNFEKALSGRPIYLGDGEINGHHLIDWSLASAFLNDAVTYEGANGVLIRRKKARLQAAIADEMQAL